MGPLKEKPRLLSKATDNFISNVKKVERTVWRFVREFVDGLNRTNGMVDNDSFNESRLLSIDVDLIGAYAEGLSAYLPEYLANFDDVERLNKLLYEGFLSPEEAARASRLVFPVERTILVDGITQRLTSRGVIRARFVQPIREILYNGIVFSQPINVLQDNLRREITSSQGSSDLLKYTRQISQDAISQFDGAINDRIRDHLGLDGFYYVGSLIEGSRDNCRELVNGTGRFADFAIEPGLYRVSDLKAIINLAKGRSGWNPATTPQTFAQYRGGYGCRHEVIYVNLTDEQSLRTLKKQL
ncbi:MAG: hypothetical protein AAGA31_05695 [Bacteroidota bacterium]